MSIPLLTVICNRFNDTHFTKQGYTGHEHLDNVRLIHMNGRVQDPTLGRFISPDPFVQSPANSQNYDRFGYTYNNPLSYTDPTGFFFKKIGKALKGIAKGIVKAGFSIVRQAIRNDLMLFVADSTGNAWVRLIAQVAINFALDKAEKKVMGSFNSTGQRTQPAADSGDRDPSGYEIGDAWEGRDRSKVLIRVGYTQAEGHRVHRQYHVFVIATNPDNPSESFITRAGPSAQTPLGSAKNAYMSTHGLGSLSAMAGDGTRGGFGFGQLSAASDTWTNDSPWDKPRDTLSVQVVGTLDMSFEDVVQSMIDYTERTNASSIPYAPLGMGIGGLNSNSYAFAYIESMGLSAPRPDLSSPGSRRYCTLASVCLPGEAK